MDPAATYSLDELCDAAAAVLRRAAPGQGDERVTELPDPRTVRYYQGLGVVDRPLRYEGRRATYGHRHLLQVVCVKLLQAQGLSLAQVQAALSGAPTARLQEAVDDALGQPVTPRPGPRSLLAAELAPGVTLTVDPDRVPDPDSLVAALVRAAIDHLATTRGARS